MAQKGKEAVGSQLEEQGSAPVEDTVDAVGDGVGGAETDFSVSTSSIFS